MVSGHTRISARSGNLSARWRLICSGLHFTHSFDCTTAASSAWSNLLALGRRPRSSACFWAAYGAYLPSRRPFVADPLRRSSRLTVAGERPIPTAIARTPAPPRTGRRSAARPPRTGIALTGQAPSAGSARLLLGAIYGQLLDAHRQPHRPQSTSHHRPSPPRTAPA